MKDQRNDFEDLCLCRLKALLPEDVAVTILADRGFGDVKLFEFLDRLGFGYVIRFRGNVQVAAVDGETRLAADWVGKGGRARLLRGAKVTAARHKVGAVVCVHATGMKEAWHLAASDASSSAGQIVKLYAKRWTIEPGFRDSKDLRFGMGLSALRIGDPAVRSPNNVTTLDARLIPRYRFDPKRLRDKAVCRPRSSISLTSATIT